ncbi:MAG: hypothetical protein H6807_11365 [Planctomycetes bacterium]|nr:hypothetical protein [Planctomycetota bacterium]
MNRTILLAVLLTASALSAHAQTTHFVPSATTPSIQSAIDAAGSGDLIQIAAGVYAENLLIVGKDLTLQGAGMNLTSIHAGSGVGFMLSSGASGKTVMRDLEIVGGSPAGIVGGFGVDLDLLSVRITGSVGYGVDFRPARNLLIEDSEIVGVTGTASFGAANIGGGVSTAAGTLTIRRSLFAMNDFNSNFVVAFPYVVSKIVDALTLGGDVLIEDCEFRDNDAATSVFLETDGAARITGCRIVDSTHFGGPVLAMVGDLGNFLEDSLIAGNSTASVNILYLDDESTLERVTIAGNVNVSSPSSSAVNLVDTNFVPVHSHLRSTVISGNTTNVVAVATNDMLTIENCLLRDGFMVPTFSGAPIYSPAISATDLLVGLEAGFRDPTTEDFSLLAGSPAVDTGIAGPGAPTSDLDGNARIVGSGIDMGCFELQNQDPGPSYAGTTSMANVLTFNGTSGGLTRSVTVDAGSIATIAVDTPVPGTISPFIIWGYLGVPGAAESFAIPFAGGDMAFLPHLLDVGNPVLFTFTNNLLAPGSGLLYSTPAPWSATGPCVPFPITMTLQGLIFDGSGPLRITNAITLHTR